MTGKRNESKNFCLGEALVTTRLPRVGERASIADAVASYLRIAIIKGRLKPGERLNEVQICEEMGVSRTPLREAFRILQSEGLLTYSARRGVIVTPISKEDVDELWAIRAALEGLAAYTAAERIGGRELKKMRQIQANMEKTDPTNLEKLSVYNTEFHKIMVSAAANKRLERMIGQIWIQTKILRDYSLFSEGRFAAICSEHGRLLDALEARDPSVARMAMEEHLKRAKAVLLQDIESGEVGGDVVKAT